MTQPPLLARALLRVAELLTPATDRLWIDAMRGDLDAAHAEGRSLSWAFGCLIAAFRLRGTAFVLAPRWRRALFLLFVTLLALSAYAFTYHVTTGAWPFHSALGFLVACVPLVAIAAVGGLRTDRIVVDDRLIRISLWLLAVSGALLVVGAIISMSADSSWAGLTAVLSTAPLLIVCSAILGTTATLTAAILLYINFRSLPPRIPRILPFERWLVRFWGVDRQQMLALADAGAPEMTFPRAWLIYSTAFSAFLLVQAGIQLLDASDVHTLGVGYERFFAYLFAVASVGCTANTLYVLAHLRFARHPS